MPDIRDSGPVTMVAGDPAADDTSHRRSVWRPTLGFVLFGTYLLFFLVVAVALWALITQDRKDEQARREAELSGLARMFEEHAAKTMDEVDWLLESSARELARLVTSTEYGNPSAREVLRAQAARQLARVAAASALRLSTADGQSLLTLRDAGLPAAITPPVFNPQDWLATPQAPMRIGKPLALGTQDSTRWQLPVERALSQDNKLLGGITVLLDLRRSTRFFQEVSPHAADRIELLREDGTVLLRHPFTATEIGTNLHGTPLFERAQQTRSAVFVARMRVDDELRIFAVRRLASHPLMVVVSRPLSVAMRDFHEMQRRLIVGAALLLSLLLALILLAYRDIRRREADRAELRRVNATLEARVGRRTAELEQTNRELLAFSYSVSHDLRTPLRAINGFAYALREDYQHTLDATARDYLDRIYRASVRMGELIDELLSLANISRQPLNFGNIDFTALCAEVSEDLRLGEPHRTVRFDIQPDMRIEGDEALLRNALTNLLGNAWKFTRSRNPAMIGVVARDEGDRVRYTVSDNGVGFDMAHAKRLFQPFQQLHGDQGYGGTGIGLASVRRIIERHGGRIWAEATPDQGARFIFELPKRMAVVRRRRAG